MRISVLIYLIVTVLVADTQPTKVPFAGTDPLGIPSITTSPTTAPVTVMVKSVAAPAIVLPKFNVALADTDGAYALGEYAITITTVIRANVIDNILYPKFFIIIAVFINVRPM